MEAEAAGEMNEIDDEMKTLTLEDDDDADKDIEFESDVEEVERPGFARSSGTTITFRPAGAEGELEVVRMDARALMWLYGCRWPFRDAQQEESVLDGLNQLSSAQLLRMVRHCIVAEDSDVAAEMRTKVQTSVAALGPQQGQPDFFRTHLREYWVREIGEVFRRSLSGEAAGALLAIFDGAAMLGTISERDLALSLLLDGLKSHLDVKSHPYFPLSFISKRGPLSLADLREASRRSVPASPAPMASGGTGEAPAFEDEVEGAGSGEETQRHFAQEAEQQQQTAAEAVEGEAEGYYRPSLTFASVENYARLLHLVYVHGKDGDGKELEMAAGLRRFPGFPGTTTGVDAAAPPLVRWEWASAAVKEAFYGALNLVEDELFRKWTRMLFVQQHLERVRAALHVRNPPPGIFPVSVRPELVQKLESTLDLFRMRTELIRRAETIAGVQIH
eukprot:g3957.t1